MKRKRDRLGGENEKEEEEERRIKRNEIKKGERRKKGREGSWLSWRTEI